MGSQAPIQLPKIDFSPENLQPSSESWRAIRAQVVDALATYGCFEVVYPQVSKEVREAVFPAMKELFALPAETKMGNFSSKPVHGYEGKQPHMPLFESMGIDDANIDEMVDKFARLMWPEGNQNFCDAILDFSKGLAVLDHVVRKMVLEELGIEKYWDSHVSTTNYLLRVVKYKPPQADGTKIGIAPHNDVCMLTILYPDDDGFEVQTKDGEWFPVAYSPDSFLVIVGVAFMAWTNDRVYSPVHRVTMPGDKERYSAGLFAMPLGGNTIQPPPELVDEEHPLLYKPYDHLEFLKFYYTAEGQRAKSAIKTYCGLSN